MKTFYQHNKQKIQISIIIFAGIFFLFYWTNLIIENKEKEYLSNAEASYAKLEKVTQMAQDIKSSNKKTSIMNEGLLSFIQNQCSLLNISQKLINLRPISTTGKNEHVSIRLENLYYDEFINLISKIESFDNLYIKNISFSKRYDNPSMIDVMLEVVKS